ncbi:DNA cytosine methyltransferase [Candidatus Mycobacterium wuenschmannii]|uniref:DNA (cytosine-5-)-methyltransferase n=1 Tax=Candidatus Mycobacterium wuenschmannii TaxID=3027808 RepID=A0ABY8VWX9_9MYCO|nr:DNA cytosine methyltransferase [Candidatus Mycobacterium wuenschmannii]WIM87441.1 DNA cytosine methyltransferase [Candidatus Mycobacterium wuenschmannii]
MPPTVSPPLRAQRIIDLFAGPGGLDVGATWLGIPVTGIELDPDACATRAAAGLDTVQGDVRAYAPRDFPEATVLTGGPPCQTFTVAGKGAGRRALDEVARRLAGMFESPDAEPARGWSCDERTELVLEPMRWALLALRADKPFHAIVLEQVPAVVPVWLAFREVLEGCGYKCAVGILRSEEFGVPQTRRRAILIAQLGSSSVQLPSPTHEAFRKGALSQAALGREPWVSMGQALSREVGFTVISNYGSGGDPRNRGRRHSGEPAATVTGKVTRNRLHLADGEWSRFSHCEAGLLQTFPHDFPWSGSDIGQQIGNAIPPRLAVHVLARALNIQLSGEELDRVVSSSWREGYSSPIRQLRQKIEQPVATAAN